MIASARTVFAFLLAAGSFAAAQQRRPLLGRVVDADGNRLANVTVNCALTPPGERRNRAIEHLTGTTDERGRFRFQVYPCTTYRLWAIGAAGEDGKRATSALQSAAAGAPFELRATEHIPAISLTVSGVKEWLDRWPLKLRLAPRGIEVPGKALPLADDGTCALPPLPLGRTAIDILDKDDNPIYSISVSSGGSQLKITLPPPCEVPMRVVDSNGKPVAGARIRQRLAGGWFGSDGLTVGVPARELWRDLGRTDADGRLAARISYRHDPFQNTNWQRLLFLADKDGYTVSHSGFTDNPYIDGKEVEREGLEELRFTLQPSRPFTGRILVGDDAGLANQPVIVHAGIRITDKDHNGWSNEDLIWHATTDENGRFAVPRVRNATDDWRVFLAGERIVAQLMPAKLHRMTPRRAIALHSFDPDAAKANGGDGCDWRLDLRTLAVTQLQFLDEHGAPANDTEVLLLSKRRGGDYDCDAWTPTTRTDSAGRAAVLLQPGHWFLFARNRTGMVYRAIEVDAPDKLELQLSAMPMVRGKVVDGRGKAVANAALDCHSSTWHSSGNRNRALESIAGSLNWGWIDGVKTGADGSFECAWLSLPGMTYEVRFRAGKKRSASFQLEPDDEPLTITIE